MGGDFLAQMAASSRARAEAARRECSEERMLELARAAPPAPAFDASGGPFRLIAELKLRSPAVGALGSSATDVAARVRAYAEAGAAAVSVLTEPQRFDGDLAHLRCAAEALAPLGVPAMRKDFLVDPYQIAEARATGAGGVLLIVRMLPDALLDAMIARARLLGLFALLETFDAPDIERLRALTARVGSAGLLAGLNSRDLSTLEVVPSRLEALAPLLPETLPRVAESGVSSPEDAHRMGRAGYDLALVGSALMRAPDPAALVAAMTAAGRAGQAER
ncbi:MAG: indole-3-glycerol-phosphate synthase [Pseudomonadota bacterium]|jgi:indole-3-glycerol phosphate synthase|nr:indole-3-glycerol-phosphate synthase [Pseudomonadota bacterium]